QQENHCPINETTSQQQTNRHPFNETTIQQQRGQQQHRRFSSIGHPTSTTAAEALSARQKPPATSALTSAPHADLQQPEQDRNHAVLVCNHQFAAAPSSAARADLQQPQQERNHHQAAQRQQQERNHLVQAKKTVQQHPNVPLLVEKSEQQPLNLFLLVKQTVRQQPNLLLFDEKPVQRQLNLHFIEKLVQQQLNFLFFIKKTVQQPLNLFLFNEKPVQQPPNIPLIDEKPVQQHHNRIPLKEEPRSRAETPSTQCLSGNPSSSSTHVGSSIRLHPADQTLIHSVLTKNHQQQQHQRRQLSQIVRKPTRTSAVQYLSRTVSSSRTNVDSSVRLSASRPELCLPALTKDPQLSPTLSQPGSSADQGPSAQTAPKSASPSDPQPAGQNLIHSVLVNERQ
ncbi:hypothetical protein AAVH_39851, partial [Aphelenchoides avenae]